MNNLSDGDLALTGESCWEHNDDEDKTSTDHYHGLTLILAWISNYIH